MRKNGVSNITCLVLVVKLWNTGCFVAGCKSEPMKRKKEKKLNFIYFWYHIQFVKSSKMLFKEFFFVKDCNVK